MSAQNVRMYIANHLQKESLIPLDKDNTHYLIRVLRCEIGSSVLIFNETNGEWKARITDIKKDSCTLMCEFQTQEPSVEMSLICGIPLIRPHLFEQMLAMGTQCGVTEFIPIHFDFTQRSSYNLERALRIMKENTEQSGRFKVPNLSTVMDFDAFVHDCGQRLCVAVEPRYQGLLQCISLTDLNDNPQALLIGPEGGYSSREISQLQKSQAKALTISGPVLRVETALPVAVGFLKGLLFRLKPF